MTVKLLDGVLDMFLQLLTLGAALDASSNSQRAAIQASYAASSAGSAASTGIQGFISFEELIEYEGDERVAWYSHKYKNPKKVTKKYSLPLGRIAYVQEVSPEELYKYDNSKLVSIAANHTGPLIRIDTHGSDYYYVAASLEDFHNMLKPKKAAKKRKAKKK